MTLELPIERDTATGRYILRFNASLYKVSNCYRKVWFTLFRGIGNDINGHKMAYGTAFHHALRAVYGEKHTIQEAVQEAISYYSQPTIHIPESDWRSIAHLVLCIGQYFEWWQREGDMLRPQWCEKPFAYPYYKTDRTEVLLCGTLDMKAQHLGYQAKVIVDHKTTSMTAIDSYLNEYEMSPQLMLYKMVDNLLFPEDPAIGCMINGIFLSRTNKNTFRRSRMFSFGDEQMRRFELHLSRRIETIVSRFETLVDLHKEEPIFNNIFLDRLFPPNYTCCKEQYGMCGYLPLCQATSAEDVETVISNNYKVAVYNPCLFQV